jgi:hypothetical protein
MHGWQVKVCKTCAHWSEATKGQCTLNSQACGQFWRCEAWESSREEAAR